MKIKYQHLLRFLNEKPSIEDLSDKLFQLGHEHEVIENQIFDMEFTPNRGDCLSLNGLARDLNVFYESNLDLPSFKDNIDNLDLNFINKSIEDCPNISFLNIEIDNIAGEYKDYLESYFKDLKINKNNFFTDISNYIAYELGQPIHSYDYSLIKNQLVLEKAKGDYEFKTLLNDDILIKKNDLVFLNNNNVINLAGIIGGKNTSCSHKTNNALIECAYFKPESIIGKAVKYNINSDASHKFERGVDPLCHEKVLRRFIKIISDHAKITKLEIYIKDDNNFKEHEIKIDINRINNILGLDFCTDQYIDILSKLGFKIDKIIKVPSYRSDVTNQNDLAEEVARVFGYDNIPLKTINLPQMEFSSLKSNENKVRQFLIKNGFNEVINNPFCDKKDVNSIKVDNPLDSNRQFLRSNIIDSVVNNLLYNERRQSDSIKLFEISDIYSLSDLKISESRSLAIIISGRRGHNFKDFSKKLDKKYLYELFNSIDIHLDHEIKSINRDGLNSKIKAPIYFIEIPLSNILDKMDNYQDELKTLSEFTQYQQISEFPSSYRDLSFLIKESSKISEVQNKLENIKAKFLKNSYMFDFYINKDLAETKIGFRMIFQSNKKTLTDQEIEESINQIIKPILLIDSVSIPGIDNN